MKYSQMKEPAIRKIIECCVAEAEIPNNEIPRYENINDTTRAILDLFNVCDSCGNIHSDGTRNNCV